MDESDVLEVLNAARIAGLAMDVFLDEAPGDSLLVRHEKVIATPIAASSRARVLEGQ